ncbi:hypothetical protein NS228_05335 [Methylobacterium indicum]|uniref:hypothetical protein n=1 Tax=Methylobacterium indicum TaxID=1775910 RepID=UPI000734CB1E|nr:hypothetical protein [Methylobacterium indicum]KTS34212.1 hypothetical protein NS229_11390 [Methylobacterium indicum]KTS41804.1 hypothetical protein NS228_05335 [Methylobacterium indicum]KTS53100.1 hypothetical protein NS230_07640 [Methylobacterium indicum]
MNALVTVTTETTPVVTAKALTIAYDARDLAIVRAQDLAAAVQAKRAELAALVTEAQEAVTALQSTTRAWKAAMNAHAAAVECASDCIEFCCDEEMDGGAIEAVLTFDPNAV